MEKGSINELVLTRSVTKHINKINKGMELGTGVGHDYSRLKSEADCSIIFTEGVSNEPGLAWIKAFNNFYVSGGKPLAVRLVVMLPEGVKEAYIKEYMNTFNELARAERVQIAGGHTQVCSDCSEPAFVVTVNGVAGSFRPDKKSVSPGCEIVMTGYTGMLGTDLLIRERKASLLNVFSKSYVEEPLPWKGEYSIRRITELVTEISGKGRVLYMHDVSCGGVYGALWQLGSFIGRGISVGHFSLPIRQETIEYCEMFGLNPYMLDGTGALLMIVSAGEGLALVDYLTEHNIPASIIGHVENNNEKMVYLGKASSVKVLEKGSPDEAVFFRDENDRYIERRCLSPVKGDEIYKVL